MFDFLKRNNKKEDSDMTEDEKQIKKAEEDIAEKSADSQTKKDRVDESVGEQEQRSGDENSQNAKDRVDESEGTKKADEKRAEEKKSEEGNGLDGRIDKLITAVESLVSALSQKQEHKESRLAELEEKYTTGMNSHGDGAGAKKQFTEADVEKLKF